MKVFTVHVKATFALGAPMFDGVHVARDRGAIVKAFMQFAEDPITRFFLDPDSTQEFTDLWQWLADRIAAYEGSEQTLISEELNGYRYTVAVEETEVIE